MQFDNFLNKQVIVTQVKGGSKFNDRQKGNLIGLGLRGIGSSAKVLASKDTLGMIKKVAHAITVQNA